MVKFKTRILGYNKRQINAYIRQTKKEYNAVMEKQKMRIFELRDENMALDMELKGYKHREEAILSAMVDSRRQAEDIIIFGRRQAIKELNSLQDDLLYIKKIREITPAQISKAIDKTCLMLEKHIEDMNI